MPEYKGIKSAKIMKMYQKCFDSLLINLKFFIFLIQMIESNFNSIGLFKKFK